MCNNLFHRDYPHALQSSISTKQVSFLLCATSTQQISLEILSFSARSLKRLLTLCRLLKTAVVKNTRKIIVCTRDIKKE
jgi:hypothetical protein